MFTDKSMKTSSSTSGSSSSISTIGGSGGTISTISNNSNNNINSNSTVSSTFVGYAGYVYNQLQSWNRIPPIDKEITIQEEQEQGHGQSSCPHPCSTCDAYQQLEEELECLCELTKHELHEKWDEVEILNENFRSLQQQIFSLKEQLDEEKKREERYMIKCERVMERLTRKQKKKMKKNKQLTFDSAFKPLTFEPILDYDERMEFNRSSSSSGSSNSSRSSSSSRSNFSSSSSSLGLSYDSTSTYSSNMEKDHQPQAGESRRFSAIAKLLDLSTNFPSLVSSFAKRQPNDDDGSSNNSSSNSSSRSSSSRRSNENQFQSQIESQSEIHNEGRSNNQDEDDDESLECDSSAYLSTHEMHDDNDDDDNDDDDAYNNSPPPLPLPHHHHRQRSSIGSDASSNFRNGEIVVNFTCDSSFSDHQEEEEEEQQQQEEHNYWYNEPRDDHFTLLCQANAGSSLSLSQSISVDVCRLRSKVESKETVISSLEESTREGITFMQDWFEKGKEVDQPKGFAARWRQRLFCPFR